MFVFTRVVGLHEAKRSVVDGDGEQAEVVCVADPWWTNGVLQEVRDEELHDEILCEVPGGTGTHHVQSRQPSTGRLGELFP